MKTRTETTKRPRGLDIKRKGNQFTFSWSKGDKNYGGGQRLQYAIKTKRANVTGTTITNDGWHDWNSISIGVNEKSKAKTLDFSNYYPDGAMLLGIKFRVCGKRETRTTNEKYYDKGDKKYKTRQVKIKYDWSDWTVYSFMFEIPNTPTTKATFNTVGKSTFSWKLKVDNTKPQQFKSVKWEAILVKNSTTTDGSKAGKWSSANVDYRSGTSTDNDSSTAITENSQYVEDNSSWTRWFRVQARGVRGKTKWVYSYHRYADANVPNLKYTNVQNAKVNGRDILQLYVRFSVSKSNGARPISRTVVQWVYATPVVKWKDGDAYLEPPADAFDSPNESPNMGDKSGLVEYRTNLSRRPTYDEAVFVRVVNYHDGEPSISKILCAEAGLLKAPVISDVATNPTLYTANVEANYSGEVENVSIAVYYKEQNQEPIFIGVIPPGETSANVQAPDWTGKTYTFGVMAFAGVYEEESGSFLTYSFLHKVLTSKQVWNNGSIPTAPTNVTATPLMVDGKGTIQVTWNWSWSEATSAVVSWADHQDAWNSTDEPEEYELNAIYGNTLNISDVETGKMWYVRVRLKKGTGETANLGDWSDIVPVAVKSAPAIPTLVLSKDTITPEETVQASWSYVSSDGIRQGQAWLCEVYDDESESGDEPYVYGTPFAHTESAQYATIYPEQLGWEAGSVHQIAVKVTSAVGEESEWSAPVPVTVANAVTCTINSTSLEDVTIVDDAAQGLTTVMKGLTDLDLTANVTGAGTGGTTRLVIERAEPYDMARPDDSNRQGYEGELIAVAEIEGEGEIKITPDNVTGYLDDGALYRLIATSEDTYGQSDSKEIDFVVQWSHQAIEPNATVAIDYDLNIAKITPTAPSGAIASDRVDIYRLSADKPELIYPNAEFGTTYVDPYPALGPSGGHRVVFKTKNGDYLTNDANGERPAWKDLQAEDNDYIYSIVSLIDFDGVEIPLMYNVDLSNEWEKDFTETKYLGGSVQGDWNPAVSRTATVNVDVINLEDEEVIGKFRRLANYAGVCHLRTLDGSSISCNIQVKEDRPHDNQGVFTSFSLAITRVDSEGYDGMTEAQWENQ